MGRNRQEDKVASLVWLLREFIPDNQPTVVFVATKHHVDFLTTLLRGEGVRVSGVYGSMDQVAPRFCCLDVAPWLKMYRRPELLRFCKLACMRAMFGVLGSRNGVGGIEGLLSSECWHCRPPANHVKEEVRCFLEQFSMSIRC